MTPAPERPDLLERTKQELLAEVLRRCMGIDADDNARHDFGDINGGMLQRPTEVATELLRALSDEGLTITAAPVTDAGLREAARLRRNVRFMGSDLPAFDGEWVAVPAADFDRLRAALSRQAEKETA
jgi:hypothetical protein